MYFSAGSLEPVQQTEAAIARGKSSTISSLGPTFFQAGLDRVIHGMKTHRVALLCAEKDPLTCHRTILVCRHLVTRGVVVRHVLEDGRIENHEEALSRLLAEHGLPERDLFQKPIGDD